MQKEKRVKKTLEELNVIDDFLFTELLLHPESADLLVRLIIERATGLKVGELIIEPQCVYNGVDTDRHGIRMDVRVQNPEISISESTDSTLRVFDIEPNVKEDKELPKRVRYYQALSDVKLLESGCDYANLPELWSIWILPYDPFKANYMIYFVKNVVEGLPEIEYNEGVHKLFLYTQGTLEGNEQLKSLLRYISKSTSENATDEELKRLHEEVLNIKYQKDVGVKYMRVMQNLYDEIKEAKKEAMAEGLAEGREAGLAEGREVGLAEGREAGFREAHNEIIGERCVKNREMLLKILARKGCVSGDVKERIETENDISVLDEWVDKAIDAETIEQFVEGM